MTADALPPTCPPATTATAQPAADDAATLVLVRSRAGAPIGYAVSDYPTDVRMLEQGDIVQVSRGNSVTYRGADIDAMNQRLGHLVGCRVRVKRLVATGPEAKSGAPGAKRVGGVE